MLTKTKLFLYLFREVDGFDMKLRFSYILFLYSLIPSIFKKTFDIKFLNFHLRFKLGQRELSPYQEIKEVISKKIFPPTASINTWTVIDCGANIGLFALFFKAAKSIISVEPNKEVMQRLAYNFETNKIRGILINKAVSSVEGDIKMTINPVASVLSKIEPAGNVVVTATTIDQIILENALERVDLLKLDLEGHELDALKGASKSLTNGIIKRIYTEFHDKKALNDLDEYLSLFSFQRTFTYKINSLYELK